MVNALSVAGSKLLSYLVQSVVVSILLVLSFIAFIVPFFFVMPRLMMAPYFLFDNRPIESIKASWAATKGHVGKVWDLWPKYPVCINRDTYHNSLITFYLIMVVSVATAILYYWIERYGNQTVVPTAPVAPVAPTPTVGKGKLCKNKSLPRGCLGGFYFGEPSGARTQDTLLKRQVL